ncbi:hypothetical protein GQ54DRAFT_12564, partial [Martensiomyces pterosporus]
MTGAANDPYYEEHRKMLAGELYRGSDPYLIQLRMERRRNIRALAEARDDTQEFPKAIRNLLGSVGDDNAIIE